MSTPYSQMRCVQDVKQGFNQ